ncbi:unnamed protein product [Peniophora sp. CBMAI 1063]|nr:unnamed protein product [Peniophora sp. CBMAI 1063]
MSMDAAEFQRRHNLEGAPDPFPSLNDPTPRKSKAPANAQAPSADSEEAFPSLAPASRPASQASSWAPRIARAAAPVVPQVTESFTLGAIDLSSAGKDGKPATLGEVIKGVLAKHKGVKIEAGSNQRARQTTFNLKAENRKELEKAKRALLAGLSPTVTLTVNAPQSTIPSIIGPKGANLKEIRDKINVRIDIPRRDNLAPGNGHANGHARSGAATPIDEDEDEPTIPISISGAQPLAEEAADILRSIIASKTAKTTQRVRDIPVHIVPFVKARRAAYVQAAGGADVQLSLNSAEREFSATGDREGVTRVIEAVKSVVAQTQAQITSVKIQLPKRQHRLLVGKAVDEIMTESHCSVTVPSPEDANEEVTVYGRAEEVGNGLTAVMAKANSQYIHEFPLPGPISLSRQLLTYIVRTGYTKSLQASHPGVTVFTPSLKSTAATLNIDLVGEKGAVDGAVRQVSGLMGKMIGAVKEVQADWLVHKLIQAKHAKKIKAFHDTNNVLLLFPPESEETSAILLVYDPTSPNASPSPVEKAKQLEDVEKEVTKWVRDAADVKTVEVPVERKWHDAVTGPNGTTLNALIGEERALSIKVGGESGHADVIIVRGASGDVDRAVKEIQTIVKDAEEDKILSGYSVEFEIDREYVARIVGAQGSAVNKLRDTLGVKVDFDDGDDGKKKKAKTHTKITGRKENVEEAKRRILAQVEKFADEAQETLKIPVQYHAGLIGEKGKYVIRLEEKYGVKITFPRESGEAGEGGRTRETLKADEVLIKGGRKGVSHAKSELLDAVEFEKENNNVAKFTIPSKAIPRILGKSGATINEIKDESGAIIDLDKSEEASGTAGITLRGSKTAIATAKKAILAIAEQAADEITVTLNIEARFHRSLIGPGGSGLKELITRCGGPSEPRAQAGLVRFPRQGEEPNDEVRLRGDKKVVEKLRTEMEKIVGELKDRVTLGVAIPASAHRALIGRGGRNLTDFQAKHGVQVQYPGSHAYNSAGTPENADELADVPREDLVKISGSRANIEAAIEDLKATAKSAAPEGVTDTVTVQLKYHHAITQQGNLFRTLRTFGVHTDESARPSKSAVPPRPSNGSAAPAARIDDTEEAAPGIQWETAENYADAEDGEATWTLKARDEAGLERAKKLIAEAQAKAERMSHVGFLTLPDRTSFPRIVGSKGANIARMHGETGADITVGRDDNTIVIMGTETAIEEAKDAILRIVNDASTGAPRGERRGGRGRGRGVDRDREY